MMRKIVVLTTVLIGALLVFGCSKNPSQPTPSASLNLNSANGGYTASNESPAFGDPTLQNTTSEEASFADPMANSAVTDSLIKDSSSGWYQFRAVWGRLVPDTSVKTVTDWTGKLEVSHGVLVLRRIIRFEPGDLILPRTDLRVIKWVSHTTTHNDGIAVDLLIRRPRPILDTVISIDTLGDTSMVVDTTWPPPPTLTLTTPPYSRTFTLAELMKLDTVVNLPDSNQVAFWGLRVHRNACPRGFLAGQWSKPDTSGLGLFDGRWINRLGDLSGFFHGHYGINADGKPVLFGKWIDSTGKFEGFLRGRWGAMHRDNDDKKGDTLSTRGWFFGRILDDKENRIGLFRGKWVQADSTAGGFMEGRWKLVCPQDGSNDSDDGMEDGMDD